jgi:hypothetical protein
MSRREMTRDEAIKVLEMFLHKQCDLKRTEFAYDANTVWDAVNMASEALEQGSVLDKIRAEIQDLRNCSCSCSDGIINDVEDIIDKYETESEG